MLVAGSVSLVGYVGQPVLCGGVGIVGCDTGLMNMMLIAILPLCFLRFAVTAQLAMGLRNQGVILAVLVAVTATVLFYQAETPSELAAGYTVSVTAIMTAYVILGLLPRQLVSRFRAR